MCVSARNKKEISHIMNKRHSSISRNDSRPFSHSRGSTRVVDILQSQDEARTIVVE